MIIPKIDSVASKTQKESSFDALAIDCNPTDNILSAEIAMVGEAPSDIDSIKNEPFTGPVGSQFNRICAAVRIARYKIYLTYACKAKFPKGNTNVLWTDKGYRHPDWSKLQAALIDELAQFPGKVIILLGATSMRLLLDEPRYDSITKYRGSFYHAEDFPHLKDKLAGKIIGLSYNPSFTLPYGKPIHFYTMIADFTKALRIIENPELLTDNTEIFIKPSFEEIMQFYALIKTKQYVSFDIEATPEFITCYSLAVYNDNKILSMSVPLMNNQGNYWTTGEEIKIWTGLAEILNNGSIGMSRSFFSPKIIMITFWKLGFASISKIDFISCNSNCSADTIELRTYWACEWFILDCIYVTWCFSNHCNFCTEDIIGRIAINSKCIERTLFLRFGCY